MKFQMYPDPARVCLVLKTRRAARAITRRYNSLLKPHGLHSTQASLLFCIKRGGFSSISELADLMAIERSALTRNIALLRDSGLISSEGLKQGKSQKVEITREGKAIMEKIFPLWLKAQEEVRQELGEEKWELIQEALSIVGEL